MSRIVRLTLVALVVLLSSAMVHAADVPHPELAEADIDTLQRGMRDGTLSSEALTRAYLDRIAALDDAGPRLDAVIELNPDALADARRRDHSCCARP